MRQICKYIYWYTEKCDRKYFVERNTVSINKKLKGFYLYIYIYIYISLDERNTVNIFYSWHSVCQVFYLKERCIYEYLLHLFL